MTMSRKRAREVYEDQVSRIYCWAIASSAPWDIRAETELIVDTAHVRLSALLALKKKDG